MWHGQQKTSSSSLGALQWHLVFSLVCTSNGFSVVDDGLIEVSIHNGVAPGTWTYIVSGGSLTLTRKCTCTTSKVISVCSGGVCAGPAGF